MTLLLLNVIGFFLFNQGCGLRREGGGKGLNLKVSNIPFLLKS